MNKINNEMVKISEIIAFCEQNPSNNLLTKETPRANKGKSLVSAYKKLPLETKKILCS